MSASSAAPLPPRPNAAQAGLPTAVGRTARGGHHGRALPPRSGPWLFPASSSRVGSAISRRPTRGSPPSKSGKLSSSAGSSPPPPRAGPDGPAASSPGRHWSTSEKSASAFISTTCSCLSHPRTIVGSRGHHGRGAQHPARLVAGRGVHRGRRTLLAAAGKTAGQIQTAPVPRKAGPQ